MSASESDKDLALLLERGMTGEEADNFLEPGTKVVCVTVQLPPGKVISSLQALAKLSLISEPVKFRFCLAGDRYRDFVKVAEEAADRKSVDITRKPGELLN